MAPRQSRALLPGVVAGTAVVLLASHRNLHSQSFLTAQRGPLVRGRTAARGFKEDFAAWRASLTSEEQDWVARQARGEYTKGYRGSEEFKRDLPDDKIQSFSRVIKKFFDTNEVEDYKKEEVTRMPNYGEFVKRAEKEILDMGLRGAIVEIDRAGGRRYQFAMERIRRAKEKGEYYPPSSPRNEIWFVKNDDQEFHDRAQMVIDAFKTLKDDTSIAQNVRDDMAKWVEKGIPPVGEPFSLKVPACMVEMLHNARMAINRAWGPHTANMTDSEKEAFRKTLPEIFDKVVGKVTDEYVVARDEVQADADWSKAFYMSQEDIPGRTKADVVRDLWNIVPHFSEGPVPPLNEDLLKDLEKIPAVDKSNPMQFRHPWGIVDSLWKSEAHDPFGVKYLLGVFETKEEAWKAFDDWNAEYEQASKDLRQELDQWGKQESARLEKSYAELGGDPLRSVYEEAMSRQREANRIANKEK